MIIKSLRRKGKAGSVRKGSFHQLYHYINTKSAEDRYVRCLSSEASDEQIIERFVKNATYIRQTNKHNLLYHEIISLEKNGDEQLQKLALYEIADKYIQKRAPSCLVFGAIHTDAKNSIHMHLMISANEIGARQRVRLGKYEFTELQKEMERYLHENYKELGERQVYNKRWEKQRSDKEEKFKKRTNEPSKKDLLKAELQKAFEVATTREELEQLLKEEGIEIVVRGKTITARQNTLKCRLKTLELLQEYEALIERENDPKAQALRELKRFRARRLENQQENIMEKDRD